MTTLTFFWKEITPFGDFSLCNVPRVSVSTSKYILRVNLVTLYQADHKIYGGQVSHQGVCLSVKVPT